jgi:hypothetical protein
MQQRASLSKNALFLGNSLCKKGKSMSTVQRIQTIALRCGLVVLSLFWLLVLLVACSNPLPSSGSTSTGTPALANTNTNLLTVLPILEQSLQATRQLKTVHVDLRASGTIQTAGPILPAFAQATPFRVHAAADLDIARQAGKARSTLTLTPAQGPPLSLKNAAHLPGGQLYLQTPSHQWFSLNLAGAFAFLTAHVNLSLPSPQVVGTLLQHVSVTDAGTTTIAGKHVRHIVFSIDQGALGQLAKNGETAQVQQVLASMRLVNTVRADLFVDSATFRPVRLEVKGGVQVNLDGLLGAFGHANAPGQGTGARMLTLTFDLRVTLSRFDQPVAQVIAPAGASPIDLMNLASPQLAG